MRRIGALMGIAESDVDAKVRAVAFQQRLYELGWTEGRNVKHRISLGGADQERMAAYVAELAAFAPDLILANTTPVVVALKKVTSTIPIVFVNVVDPVGRGFVASLARPGGNIRVFHGRQVAADAQAGRAAP